MQLKETSRTRRQETTLPLDLPNSGLMRHRLHAAHCMTTRRPAAATQTRARVSRAMHPKVYAGCPSATTLPISGLGE